MYDAGCASSLPLGNEVEQDAVATHRLVPVALRKNAKVELLRRTTLFAGCSKRELAEIALIADEIDLPAGTAFIREGEPGREFVAIIEGAVDVRRKGRSVKIKGGSDFFGEMSLLSDAPRNASVVAKSPVRALVVTARDFQRLMTSSPQLQGKVLRAVAARIAAAEPV
jgi:CRP-like cAMP-binding protein